MRVTRSSSGFPPWPTPDEAAEFRRNGNLEWDLPTGVIWWDERMHVLWASLWVTWPLDEASTW
jgi:hypothetical protein